MLGYAWGLMAAKRSLSQLSLRGRSCHAKRHLSKPHAAKAPAPPKKKKGGAKPRKGRQSLEKQQVQLEALNLAAGRGDRVDSSSANDSEGGLLGHSISQDQHKRTKGDGKPAEVTVIRKKVAKRKLKPRIQLKGTLYDYPKYYDWAVAYRDYEQEVDFLFDAYEVISGDEPLSFVELGSGPSQHSLEMAESKLDVYAVEISPMMIDYSTSLAAADDLQLTWLQQDMRSFKLPEGKQVDLAACLLGSMQHMHTLDDGLQMLQSTNAALKTGGLFIVELVHPLLLFDGSVTASGQTWRLEVDTAQLEVFWGHEGDLFDPFKQIIHKTVAVDIDMLTGERLQIKNVFQYRQYTFQELALLARLSGFEIAATFEDFDLKSRMAYGVDPVPGHDPNVNVGESLEEDHTELYRMLIVLRKVKDSC